MNVQRGEADVGHHPQHFVMHRQPLLRPQPCYARDRLINMIGQALGLVLVAWKLEASLKCRSSMAAGFADSPGPRSTRDVLATIVL